MNIVQTTDPKEKKDLLNLAMRRYIRASINSLPWMQNAVRFLKIYREFVDATQNEDEADTFLPYAYGLVESIVYKMSEPILKMVPPCRVLPKRIGDDDKAFKFEQKARNFYTASDYQLGYIDSCRSEAIIGSAWELDRWHQEYLKARRWANKPATAPLDSMQGMDGKAIPLKGGTYQYTDKVEEEFQYPNKIGYGIDFPEFLTVLPEDPGLKTLEQQHWIIHSLRRVAVDDLKKQMYTDPKTGEKKPAFDLTELIKDAGEHRDGGINPVFPWKQTDYDKIARDVVNAQTNDSDQQAFNDVDAVWLLDFYEKDRIWSVANGAYIVRDIREPWQKPRIPWRLRTYTQDPQFLYGIGVIQPIEDLIYELNDIHNLSFASWLRIINKMVVYNEGAIPFPDDFKPSAEGRIRVQKGIDVRTAIMEIPHTDPAPSMIGMETNVKGLMEWSTSVSDLSPGPGGQKQGHKTARGLAMVQQNLQTRFSTILRQQLANSQKQMTAMEQMLSQFQFDPVPMREYRDDGTTILSEFSREMIDTQGLGFDYVISIDPSLGDDVIKLNFLFELFDQGLKYNQYAKQMGEPGDKIIDLGIVMRDMLPRFGYNDVSNLFRAPNNIKSPQQELDMIAGGKPVTVQPGEDLIGHWTQHKKDLANPNIVKAMQAGKASPKTLEWLAAHVAQTEAAIRSTLQDPQFASRKMGQGVVPGARQ